MTPEEFYQLLKQQQIELTDRQQMQFERYFELLVEWNKKINLTAITEKKKCISSISMTPLHPFCRDALKTKISNYWILEPGQVFLASL
ncbi:hypothetical protein HMPREF9682_00013 [Streptococcus intermedius F0395]|nr:hypothetical protein HMPREF9682_00013 [Streptococcus intermedius F0395]